jgi:uncharacterized protein (TIGR02284 family)
LKNWFEKQGARRTLFAAPLTKERNETPELEGSFTGDMHRGWMNIKAAVSFNTDLSLLEVCLTRDKWAIMEHNEGLEHKRMLLPAIASVLEAQKDEIQATRNKVKRLENFAHH